MRIPHIGPENAQLAMGKPSIAARNPMQPPMEWPKRCQGRGKSSALAAAITAVTSRW